MGTFGRVEISVPPARLTAADGKTSEWKSKTLSVHQRHTWAADALIAGAYLSAPTPAGCAVRLRRCLAARSARTW